MATLLVEGDPDPQHQRTPTDSQLHCLVLTPLTGSLESPSWRATKRSKGSS